MMKGHVFIKDNVLHVERRKVIWVSPNIFLEQLPQDSLGMVIMHVPRPGPELLSQAL